MADALSVLKKFHIEKREIKEGKDKIIFGDVSLPKTLLTNYIVWGTGKDGIAKDYYTLESLLFFVNNSHLSHPHYVRKAAADNVMVVRRPDRKDLLSFLTGEVEGVESIDTSLDFVENKLTEYPRQRTEKASSLTTALTSERIASIKEKIKRKKYDSMFDRGVSDSTSEFRERIWTNRNNVLNNTHIQLWQGVRGVLQALKPSKPVEKSTNSGMDYNRYDQERFNRGEDTGGFKIDTTGTFSGVPKPNVAPQKRRLRTPIIIIPAAPSSLITMSNVEECLVNLRFVSPEEMKKSGGAKSSEVLIVRKVMEQTRRYRVIDSVVKLQGEDWLNVVAVFVQGPMWQFKGWPWQGNPSEIFSHMKAFHLKFSQLPSHENIGKWSVNVLTIDRERRHEDEAVFTNFWNIIDEYMDSDRHYYH